MSIRGGRRRLRVFAVATIAALVVGSVASPATADETAVPSPDAVANAELLQPMCAVPADRDLAVTRTVWSVAKSRGVTAKVMLAAFEAGWVESHMNNLNCGDRDSLGVFQQRPSMGWCSPSSLCLNVTHATNKFLDQAIPNDRNNPGYTAGQLAQSVQRSAYPARYDQAESKARSMMAEVGGSRGADGERVSDFSGDGHADVLGVDATGKFWYYPNNGNRLSPRKQIGHGWQNFTHVMSADWSGDGSADVLGVTNDGRLMYYPNNGHTLYKSKPKQLGTGWGSFLHVMSADWSGDGKADVLAVNTAGKLLYYPHNGSGLSAPVEIGHGWDKFTQVTAADWSGDGKADVLCVDQAGNLYYYPHSGNGFGNRVQIGHGWGGFTSVWASDFSGDGKADVLGVSSSGDLYYYPHHNNGFSPRVKLGHGWGSFLHVM